MPKGTVMIGTGIKIALVSCPALGDTTLYLRLAWRLQAAGVEVTLASASLASIREYLPGLVIVGEQVPDVRALAEQNDLVICAVDWLVNVFRTDIDLTSLPNVAFLAGKKLPVAHRLHERQVTLRGELVPGAHNVICRDPKAGKSMVEWMDLYAEEVLGLDLAQPLPGFASLPEPGSDAGRRVVIFPTTPHASKNYSTSGFQRLARLLVARGWHVEFAGIPVEKEALQTQYPGFVVNAFADLKGLIDYLRTCSVVISNDSGGGHLGSLLGLRTFTITRRRPDFTWRPAFNPCARVIDPLFTFKWMGKTIWRPFIPLGRILKDMQLSEKR